MSRKDVETSLQHNILRLVVISIYSLLSLNKGKNVLMNDTHVHFTLDIVQERTKGLGSTTSKKYRFLHIAIS